VGKRHRRHAGSDQHGRLRLTRRIADGTVTAVPSYRETSRPGLDGRIFVALLSLDELVRDMRSGVKFPSEILDGESALQSYLLYVSILVDIVLADIVMSAMNCNDQMVRMKLRMLVEYAAKAAYFDDNRDYALWMMTINEAEQTLRKLTDAESEPQAKDAVAERIAILRAQFPHLAHFQRPERFGTIMRRYASSDDVVWLYNAPSALMHGDPEGFRALMDVSPDGAGFLRIELAIEEVNAMLVDSGRNALMFCDRFIRCFRQADEDLAARYRDIYTAFLKMLLLHPLGRDAESLQEVKDELAVRQAIQ